MSPRNAQLAPREPSRYEMVLDTMRYVKDLDERINQLSGAVETSKAQMEAYLAMAAEEEEAYNANRVHLAALEGERDRFGTPEEYQRELFKIREAGE